MRRHRTLVWIGRAIVISMLLSVPVFLILCLITVLYVRAAKHARKYGGPRIFGPVDLQPPQFWPRIRQPDQFPDRVIEMDVRER